ncbi:MAG: hypothetical protein ACXWCS_14320 [Burkholderiales bacterium]
MSSPCLQCGIDNDLHIFDEGDPTAHDPWTAKQEIEFLRKQRDEARNEVEQLENAHGNCGMSFEMQRRNITDLEAALRELEYQTRPYCPTFGSYEPVKVAKQRAIDMLGGKLKDVTVAVSDFAPTYVNSSSHPKETK